MYNTRKLAFTKKLLRLVDLDQYPQSCTLGKYIKL